MKKKGRKKKSDELANIADFLFEVGILAKTPRSGFAFLGGWQQSVAEHINRVVFVGFVLATRAGADVEKVMKMCLFHDLEEARTSDLNYVHQQYAKANQDKARKDMAAHLPFGDDLLEIIDEYEERKSKEAKLAKDADQLELLLSLKEMTDVGNERAETWMPPLLARLKTREGKELARQIKKTDFDNWWYHDKKNDWWVKRDKKK